MSNFRETKPCFSSTFAMAEQGIVFKWTIEEPETGGGQIFEWVTPGDVEGKRIYLKLRKMEELFYTYLTVNPADAASFEDMRIKIWTPSDKSILCTDYCVWQEDDITSTILLDKEVLKPIDGEKCFTKTNNQLQITIVYKIIDKEKMQQYI